MFDYEEVVVIGASAFFVVLAFGLLLKYRQASEVANESADLGRDLWNSMESRLRKQDERILDVMTRLDVLQARVLAAGPATQNPQPAAPVNLGVSSERAKIKEEWVASQSQREVQHVEKPESHEVPSESQQYRSSDIGVALSKQLDATQMTVVGLLGTRAMDTREITNALNKSREHTARIMKELFERGIVKRTTSEKPFTYELTDRGRGYLST